jgi:multiple sugar transport system substrate-binding protein
MTVSKSAAEKADLPQGFVEATINSLEFAKSLPPVPETSDFVNTAWPVNMQLVLTGKITPAAMMEELEKHYYKK